MAVPTSPYRPSFTNCFCSLRAGRDSRLMAGPPRCALTFFVLPGQRQPQAQLRRGVRRQLFDGPRKTHGVRRTSPPHVDYPSVSHARVSTGAQAMRYPVTTGDGTGTEAVLVAVSEGSGAVRVDVAVTLGVPPPLGGWLVLGSVGGRVVGGGSGSGLGLVDEGGGGLVVGPEVGTPLGLVGFGVWGGAAGPVERGRDGDGEGDRRDPPLPAGRDPSGLRSDAGGFRYPGWPGT